MPGKKCTKLRDFFKSSTTTSPFCCLSLSFTHVYCCCCSSLDTSYIYVWKYVYINLCVSMRVHGWMYVYMKGYASIQIYVYICRYTYEYICTNIHQPIRTHIHKKSKHTHTHTHLHINNYILERIIIYIYSRLQIRWHRILRFFLKTFNVVAGVPGFSWELSLVPSLRGINHKFHVQSSGSFNFFTNILEILCHPICDRIYVY